MYELNECDISHFASGIAQLEEKESLRKRDRVDKCFLLSLSTKFSNFNIPDIKDEEDTKSIK